MRNPYLLDRPAVVSFSGGRTSGYMLWHIIQAFGGTLPADVKVLFANTGKERVETLEFVAECERRWAAPITWLEYRKDDSRPVVVPGRNGQPAAGRHGLAVVDYATASRDGRPFDDVIATIAEFRQVARDGGDPLLPGVRQRYCTAEMKVRTMARYLASVGFPGEYQDAVGLRADEPQRVARAKSEFGGKEVVYPLYSAGVTEADVMAFWAAQPFDLRLAQHEGNCDLCFLKGGGKVRRIMRERPDLAEWWVRTEERVGKTFRTDRPPYRVQLELAQRPGLFDAHEPDDLSIACHCTD